MTTIVRPSRRVLVPALAILATVAMTLISFAQKSTCLAFDTWNAGGVSVHSTVAWGVQHYCGTDIQRLWLLRKMWEHLPPYLHGVFVPPDTLTGGTVEYPVLSGVWIWATSLFATTDTAFMIVNTVLFVPIAVATTWLLWRMAGRRVWLWALAPALVNFGVYNWDLLPVLCSVGGLAVVVLRRDRWSDARIGIVAGLLFGVGGALKLYPAFLALPLALWLLRRALDRGADRKFAVGMALRPLLSAAGLIVLVNLPFAILGFKGWWASFDFQSHRGETFDAQSLWYWVLRPFVDTTNQRYLPAINVASTVLVAMGIIAVLLWCWFETRGHEFPLMATCAAVVAAYMVLGKVHSPQYILWLIPLLALSRIRVRWILVYYAIDLLLWVMWNTSMSYALTHDHSSHLYVHGVALGVGLRALAITAIIVVALRPKVLREAPMGVTGELRVPALVPAREAQHA